MISISYSPQKTLSKKVMVPGSKYVANRLLLMAALSVSQKKIFLRNCPHNKDIEVAKSGLRKFGAEITDQDNFTVAVKGIGSKIGSKLDSTENIQISSHESGTFSRFILSFASLFTNEIFISGAPAMNRRPLKSLTDTLTKLGVTIRFLEKPDHLPLSTQGVLRGGKVEIEGDVSSQYISSLLMALPVASSNSEIKLMTNLVSESYVALTLSLLKQFQIEVVVENSKLSRPLQPTYHIKGGQQYHPLQEEITLESDPSSATYFLALAALTDKTLEIDHFNFDSLQGETKFYELLEQMGCIIEKNSEKKSLKILGRNNKPLQGITADMGTMPDAVPTLCILAATAKGTTLIKNISHLRYKESNRVEDLAKELRKMGVKIVTSQNEIVIQGKGAKKGNNLLVSPPPFESHNDHRLVMSLSLLATQTDHKIMMVNSQAVEKSFPDYFLRLQELGFKIDKD